MSFWWEITSLVQHDLNHSLKWMQYRPKLIDMDEDVVVEEIPDTMVLIIIIFRKWKPHCTTRSGTIQNGTILRQNETRQDVYKFILGWKRELFLINGIDWDGWTRFEPSLLPSLSTNDGRELHSSIKSLSNIVKIYYFLEDIIRYKIKGISYSMHMLVEKEKLWNIYIYRVEWFNEQKKSI